MFPILILLSYLLSFGLTNQLTNEDFLNERLELAALDVISMHSLSTINKDLSTRSAEDTQKDGQRNLRSVPSFFNIPILDNTKLELVPEPELMRAHKISEMMNNLKERFLFHQTYLQKISDALRYAVRPNANQLVLTPHLLRNLTVLNRISVNQIKSLSNIFWQNSILTVNDLKYKLKDLIISIDYLKRQISAITQTTNDIVLKNRPSIISGHKHFVGHNEISSIDTISTTVGSVGHQNIRQVMSDLYKKSRPQTLLGIKQIVRPTFVKDSLNSGLINGINFNQQMVTTNNRQIIKSKIYFDSQLSIVNDLIIRGKLNNIDLKRDLVFLNKPEVVPTPKLFTSPLIIAQILNSQTINGINFKQFSQNVLMSNGLQNINSKLLLVKPLTTKDIRVDGMVNHIDISVMTTQLVYKNRPILVRGKKDFILDDIHIKNNIFVRNRIDGQLITEDLFLKNRDQIISAPKVFSGIIKFEARISVNGFIDGLHLPQDVVTLTRNETILGPIVFGKSLIANQDIEAHRLVDSVDLSDLQLYSLKMNDKLIQSDVRFQKPVSVDSVQLRQLVNGLNLTTLFNEAIFRGNPSVEISGTKSFDSNIQMKQIYSNRVNGFDLNDLISANKNETIVVPKIFSSLTDFNSILVNGFVSRVNVTELYRNRISLSKPETIYGIKNFANEITVSNGFYVSKINGFVPQIDFVLKSKPQLINGQKIFIKPLNANKIMAMNLTSVKGKIDGIPLHIFNSRAIRLNSYLTTSLNIVLMKSNSSFVNVFKDLNHINISEFANNVMSLSRPQIVFAPKLFRNEQKFSSIKSVKGISRISLNYLNANSVHLNGFSQISAPFTLIHPIVFNKPLFVEGVVNGVNLSYIASDAVYKTGHKLITGQNVFKFGFRVNGNIHSSTFNGIDLSNELLTNTRNHIIRRKVKFTKTLNINGDILLNGLINGLKLSEFNQKIMKTNDKNIINGNLELIGPTKVMTNLTISGRLNGINLVQLFNNAVFLHHNQQIIGSKILKSAIHLLSNLNTTNLNNINVKQILSEIVYINSVNEQQIISPKVFTNDIISNGLIQSNGNAIMGPINGLNLIELDSESIKTNLPTNLGLIRNFKDLTIITNNFTRIFGRINGIDLERDVINVNINNRAPQLISGNKVFEHLVLKDNLLIDGLVNGFSLRAIQLNTLFTTNDQRIINHKIVSRLLELFADNNIIATLNGKRIPEDFVTLNTNQTIFGSLVFSDPLFVNKNILVTGSVSGHNLTKLVLESLVKDRSQVISKPIKFDSIVFRQDVTVDQHVDSVDLSRLSNTVKQFTSVVNISKDLLEVKASRHHSISDYLYKSIEKSLYEIDSFNLYQSLDESHGNHIQLLSDNVFTLSESIENPKTVHSIRFNPKTGLFDISVINQNPVTIQKSFILNGEEFVINFSPFAHNITSYITKSGQLMATITSSLNSIEVLKLSESYVLLISFQSNTGKLLVHSYEALPNKRYIFTQITEAIVGTDVGTETSKVIAFLEANEVLIVVAKHFGLNCMTDLSGTLIFILRNYRTIELIQKIPVINVVDVIHFESNGKHYLVLSDGTSYESSMNPQTIYIYRSDLMKEKCRFSLFQKLYLDNVLQLSAFTYGTIHSQQQYLVAINSSNVLIWKQRGESGFTEKWSLQMGSARVVSPMIIENNLFLIIGQKYKCHESLIFKGESTGIAVAPIVLRTKYN